MKRKIFISILVFCLVLSMIGCSTAPELSTENISTLPTISTTSDSIDVSQNSVAPSEEEISSNLTITALDVGQGLCVLFESDDHYLLFDGADRDYASYVVSYLQGMGIGLDYVIASHPHDDHINGLVGVLKTIPVKHIIDSGVVASTRVGQSYETEKANCVNNGTKYDVARPGDVFQLGSSKFTILSPSHEYDDVNNMSVAIKIENSDFSCIVTGDAEQEAEQDMLAAGIDLDVELYIAGHHGSSTSSSEQFLEAMSPSVTWISCGADNEYGHPHTETIARLNHINSGINLTSKNGTLSCVVVDGNIQYACEREYDMPSKTEDINTPSQSTLNTTLYILNTNTKKIHVSTCSHVESISSRNKKEYQGDMQTLIADGYSTCKQCNPA